MPGDPSVCQEHLPKLSAVISRQTGLHFPPERSRDLLRGVSLAARELGISDIAAFIKEMLGAPLSPGRVGILARHLTVGETYFFREPAALNALRDQVLPELIQSRRGGNQRLRLWSAGCCTGEEPYSLAMILRQLLPNVPDWNLTILGTDLNVDFLKKAAAGVYTEWSFRDTPSWLKPRFFKPNGKGFEIKSEIRQMVTWGCLNLAVDPFPSLANNTEAMDLILCRNVLMYFSPPDAGRIVRQFHHALADGGRLILSAGDASLVDSTLFDPVSLPGVQMFQKPPPGAGAEPLTWLLSHDLRGEDWSRSLPGPVETGPAAISATSSSEPDPTPSDRRLRLQAATELYERGRYGAAEEQLEPLLARSPEKARGAPCAEVFALMARICANEGRLAEALAWCEQGLAAGKLQPSLHFLKAAILQSQNLPDAALPALRRALFLAPDFVLAHYALGNLHQRAGRTHEAGRHWRNARTLLRRMPREELLPEADGLTAGRLLEIIETTAGPGSQTQTP